MLISNVCPYVPFKFYIFVCMAFFREFLINPSVEPRKRGTQLMADVLRKLPSDFLMEKEGNRQDHKLI